MMDFTIDRSLPVPVHTQLKGQIEYGITYGLLAPGSRLPNVKDLAKQLNASPITISTVYKALKANGVIESAPGRGTFVAVSRYSREVDSEGSTQLDVIIAQLLETAEYIGLSRPELLSRIDMRASQRQTEKAMTLALIGVFDGATHDYAFALHPYLAPADKLASYTFQALQENPDLLERVKQADLVMTFSHRLTEATTLLNRKKNVMGINFIPSEPTRVALAQISPVMRVGLVSTFADFLHPLKNGVSQFAPHATITQAAVINTDQIENVSKNSDLVIFATGAESVLELLPPRTAAFEFKHVPDPKFIMNYVLPEIQKLRAEKTGVGKR